MVECCGLNEQLPSSYLPCFVSSSLSRELFGPSRSGEQPSLTLWRSGGGQSLAPGNSRSTAPQIHFCQAGRGRHLWSSCFLAALPGSEGLCTARYVTNSALQRGAGGQRTQDNQGRAVNDTKTHLLNKGLDGMWMKLFCSALHTRVYGEVTDDTWELRLEPWSSASLQASLLLPSPSFPLACPYF